MSALRPLQGTPKPPAASTSLPTSSSDMGSSRREGKSEVCGECGKEKPKYTCPRCERRTCSLSCSKDHKVRLKCSGKRDRTKFVSMSKFSDRTMNSDYHFLEEMGEFVNCSRRDTRMEKRNTMLRGRKRLKSQATKLGIELKLMPSGMLRQSLNRSQASKNSIKWTIELDFADAGLKILRHRVSDAQTWIVFIESVFAEAEYAHKLKIRSYFENVLNLTLLVRNERLPANRREFYKISPEDSISESLRGKLLVEFPSIIVLKSKEKALKYKIYEESKVMVKAKEIQDQNNMPPKAHEVSNGTTSVSLPATEETLIPKSESEATDRVNPYALFGL
ncbi:hypothetical protein AAMO2058_000369600 [Amorphochlora amoebiformis]